MKVENTMNKMIVLICLFLLTNLSSCYICSKDKSCSFCGGAPSPLPHSYEVCTACDDGLRLLQISPLQEFCFGGIHNTCCVKECREGYISCNANCCKCSAECVDCLIPQGKCTKCRDKKMFLTMPHPTDTQGHCEQNCPFLYMEDEDGYFYCYQDRLCPDGYEIDEDECMLMIDVPLQETDSDLPDQISANAYIFQVTVFAFCFIPLLIFL
jgi:hypothetical protein